jgi:hypothetical protein
VRGDLIAAITAGPVRNLVQPVVAGFERAMPRLPPLDAVQGCAVTRQAALHPATLAAPRRLRAGPGFRRHQPRRRVSW